MTMIAKTWPSMLPHIRENAMSAMFAALSISSRQSSMTSGLRRVSTPPAPMQNTSAETIRYQSMLTRALPRGRDSHGEHRAHGALGVAGSRPAGRARGPACPRPSTGLGQRADAGGRRNDIALTRLLLVDAAAAAREDDRADRGDQQQERGDLERDEELRQERLADLLGAAEADPHGRALGVSAASPEPSTAIELDEQREREAERERALARPPTGA